MRIKRLTAIIVMIMLVFTQHSFIINSAAEGVELQYTEDELAFYASKLDLLMGLGVIPSNSKSADEYLTRSEFAGVIAKMMGDSIYEASYSANAYMDVKESTENSGAITALKNMGLMTGVSSVEFRPNQIITFTQAVKVLVGALGYRELAEVGGGYYSGYMKKAVDLKLLRNIDTNYDSPLTWYNMVMMLDAALDVEIPIIYSVSDRIKYERNENSNMLSAYHDIYKIEGVMTDNGQTALNGKSTAGIGNTEIGDVKLMNMPEKFTELIGHRVIAYYSSESDKQFVYAYSDTDECKVEVLNAYDLALDDSRFSKTNICVDAGKKIKNYRINQYADFIYNGSAYPRFNVEDFKIPNGTLTLIDTDNDEIYDTVSAQVYEDVWVKTVNTATGTIYSSYFEPIKYENYETVHFYNLENKEISPADMKNGTILSVYRSKDNTKLIAYLSDESSVITIDSVTDKNSSTTYITAEEKTYRISSFYQSAMNNVNINLKAPVIGGAYTIYLNYKGEIAVFDEQQPREEYAYLLAVAKETGFPNEGKPKIKIVNERGEVAIVYGAKKFTLVDSSGTYPDDADQVVTSGDLFDESGNFIPQLVKVKINSKGEFTKLEYDHSLPGTDELPNGFDETKFTMIASGTSTPISTGLAKAVSGKYRIDKNTKIFLIESDVGTLITTDEDKVKVVDYSDLPFVYVDSVLYDADQNWTCGAIVCSPNTTNAYDDRAFTVKSSKMILDEFGETRLQVEGYWKNNLWTFREVKSGVFESAIAAKGFTGGVKCGDMFRIVFDHTKSEIVHAYLIASPSRDLTDKRESLITSGAYATSTHGYVIGTPVTGTDSSIGIMSDKEYFVDTIATNTYALVLDLKRNTLEMIERDKIPTVGSVDKNGKISIGDNNVKIVAQRERYFIRDILIVLK